MSAGIEAQFDMAVASMGGKRLSEYVGQAPTFENADYIFPEHKVIAELKCLDEDKINDEHIIEKASELYVRELKAGRALEIVFGTVRATPRSTHALSRISTERRCNSFSRRPTPRSNRPATTCALATISD